jgi:hypothetical protein
VRVGVTRGCDPEKVPCAMICGSIALCQTVVRIDMHL